MFLKATLEGLFAALDRVHSKHNLVVIDKTLAPLINQLTPVSTLKSKGNIDRLVWLQQDLATDTSIENATAIIVIIADSSDITPIIPLAKYRLHIVVANMLLSTLAMINDAMNGRLNDVLSLTPLAPMYSCLAKCKVYPWKVYPIATTGTTTEDLVTVLEGSFDDYVHNPLRQLNQLSQAVVDVSFPPDAAIPRYKFRNRFAKGTHAEALVKLIDEVSMPAELARRLQPTEQEFYHNHQHADTDLVVIDRSVDWTPVWLDQVTYEGLIDEVFGVKYNQVQNEPYAVPDDVGSVSFSEDKLFDALALYNFLMVGPTLNKMARDVQAQQQEMRVDSHDISQMKRVVLLLGLLLQQQHLIKRHTTLAELILLHMDTEFLRFETELFDGEYADHINQLHQLLWQQVLWDRAVAAVVLILLVNDGIRPRDWEWFRTEFIDNYGTDHFLVLELVVSHGLVAIKEDNDFLTTFTRGKDVKPAELVVAPLARVGITGAELLAVSNYKLVDKFWNLHPNDVDDNEEVGGAMAADSIGTDYPLPGFALPGNTVPVALRLVESLYNRSFLTYKPVPNTKKRPNWHQLGVNQFWKGPVVDDGSDGETTTTVVVMVGGITYGELATFKWLEQRLHRKFVVIAPEVINRRRAMGGFS